MNRWLNRGVTTTLFICSLAVSSLAQESADDTHFELLSGPDGASGYVITRGDRVLRRVYPTSYVLQLRRARFDPLTEGAPDLTGSPLSPGSGRIAIVQFWTQPLEEYRQSIRTQGGDVLAYLPGHAHLVRLDPSVRAAVAELPCVRWIGDYHPEYRLEPELLEALVSGTLPEETRVYVQVHERGIEQKRAVAAAIEAQGGRVEAMIPEGFRLEASLSPAALASIVALDEVLYVDRWSPPEHDMNIVRQTGGANYLEMITGYTGQGVRAEAMDGNVRTSHVDFQSNPIILHGPRGGDASHGTPVTGIVFGDGTGSANGRGMMPDAQPIFGDYNQLTNRYTHTAELVNPPYDAVFQTNSWGGGRTLAYNSTSMEMDDIILLNDIVITQSQSNAGDQMSRPQAWAKNIVSVGGIRHMNTLTRTDDAWNSSASIGPAADGRIKPDLSYFYDSIRSPSSSSTTAYTQFGGTSAATPMTAGHFGLFFQMWSNGIFGNTPTGTTVFENRPHATTAKAMMINTASAYDFSGTGHDLTRVHQGWGLADVARLYDKRDRFFIVDESEVLPPLGSYSKHVFVPGGEPELRATLVFMDAPGTTSSGQHRINDLTLRVTSPTGVVYWGNNGLLAGNWSTPGGAANTRDTVENVLVQMPQSGLWQIEVFADEVNADTHLETPALDADFALVVSGVDPAEIACGMTTPAPPAFGDIAIDIDTFSLASPTVDLVFEFSLDGGASWLPATASASSLLPNPATGVATGATTFLWDAIIDGVGITTIVPGVLVRATAVDGVAPYSAVCTTSGFDVIPPPPTCVIATPVGVATMDVPFSVDLASLSATVVDVLFEFSINSGTSWNMASAAASSALSNPMTSVPVGSHIFTWDSDADGVALLLVESSVQLRVSMDDRISPVFSNCTTLDFVVDNVPPSPVCTVNPPSAPAFNDVTIDFDASSLNQSMLDLNISWSTDGGATFSPCSASPSSSVPNPAIGHPNGPGSFIWRTIDDSVGMSTIATGVIVRIVASDGIAPVPGTCDSLPFDVDNLPPRCTLTPVVSPATSTAWGGVDIELDAMSSHGTSVVASFEHSTDGGTSWRVATATTWSAISSPSGPTTLGVSRFTWDSIVDGVGLAGVHVGVLMRASVIDGVGPIAGSCMSLPFDVDNTLACGGICGDCDQNQLGPDILDSLVAAQIAAMIVAPTSNQEACCDVDSSGGVTVLDSLMLAQSAVMIPVSLMCP